MTMRMSLMLFEEDMQRVTLHYECDSGGRHEGASVGPTFFQEAGNPICETCDGDMTLFKVEVNLYQPNEEGTLRS